ncbi:MAG: polysaccharide biosynthesis tyrosine autokinase [Bacteroidetes bacterium]|nr:polysaccharide biosynthesis tyrosine autokinase [Bacteroidota bacterium]
MIENTASSQSINQFKTINDKLSSNFDISLITFLANKSKYIIALFFVVIFVGCFFYLRYSQRVYESKTIIQINEQNTANQLLKINGVSENQNIIAEAVEQIKSKIFLKRIVQKLGLEVGYFAEGRIKNNELYTQSPFFVKINLKNKSKVLDKVIVEFADNLKSGYLNNNGNKIKFNVNEWVKTPEFDINVYLNDNYTFAENYSSIKENKAMYFQVYNIDEVTNMVQQKLDVRLLNDLAKTILIRFTDNNPKKTTEVVNAIAEEFLSYDVERKSESSKKIIEFIDNQLTSVYNDLKKTETDLQTFKREKNFKVNENSNFLNPKLIRYSNIEDQMLQIEIEEKIISDIQEIIAANKSIDSYQLISLISGTEYENLIKESVTNIQKLLMDKENMLYKVTTNSESIKQVNYQIENQKKLLIQSLDAVKQKYRTKYKSLLEKTSAFKDEMFQKPEDEIELSRLNRIYSISEKYYTLLLEKKTEFSISKAGYVTKNIILERAVQQGNIISPIKKNSIVISFILALFLSICLVFIRYILHDKIYNLKDITSSLNTDVGLLGIVPKYNKEIPVSQLVVDKNPKSIISEAFRAIRSNLSFIDNTEDKKIIAVTSSISGEGKTFIALNIAGIIAFTGKKVILLDLDMRKPKVHIGFGVTNNVGMSTILTNMSAINECIHKTTLENLEFITAGPTPPNPSELIIGKKLDEVLADLHKIYDYIVIDNAPVGLVTDGITAIQKANYPIYVFRAGYSKKQFAHILDKLKNENKISKLSIVLNDAEINKRNYGYNYGYGYGYGYGTGYYTD